MNAEDDYEHANPALLYSPSNVPGSGIDEDLFSETLEGC